MKEATGELNITVITIAAIAAVVALFYALIWPSLRTRMISAQICNNEPGTTAGTEGTAGWYSCGTGSSQYTCKYRESGKSADATVTCKVK